MPEQTLVASLSRHEFLKHGKAEWLETPDWLVDTFFVRKNNNPDQFYYLFVCHVDDWTTHVFVGVNDTLSNMRLDERAAVLTVRTFERDGLRKLNAIFSYFDTLDYGFPE